MIENKSNTARKTGLWLSALCAVHCILLPVLLVLMPAFGHFLEANHWIEVLILASVFFGGGYFILKDFKSHKIALPLVLFLTGFAGIILAHGIMSSVFSMGLLIAGSIFLVVAQLMNQKLHYRYFHS